MKALSKHQQKVLEYLKAGGRGFYSTGFHAHYWLAGSDLRMTYETFKALQSRGLVKKTRDDWRGFTFIYNEEENHELVRVTS